MLVSAGSKLGPYEILSPLGAGGMGEVYRARDGRLGREVAIKLLPASYAKDADRLRRFEQEAKAAGALNHPNLLTVFDVGQHDAAPFIVSELLEGATLRTALAGAGLPVRKALDYAAQIARGLAAAHDKGILHRDLKPENVFVTKDGRAKILDFGLAKLVRPAEGFKAESEAATVTSPSTPGTVLGTVGYMSPEQVQGLPADQRSDMFSFGAVLYEMLSGRRAFKGATAVETMNAILKEDPPELSGTSGPLPPALERIVRRCLEKSPDERFRSAHDVAFALEALSGSGVALAAPAAERRPRRIFRAGLALALLSLPAVAYLVGQRRRSSEVPQFHQLTFRRGAVASARFTADGRTVVYGARWDGQPFRVFSTRTEGPEAVALPLPDADVLAVSSRGELAIALNPPHLTHPPFRFATLATVPLGGGEPREVARDVQSADYSPDGAQIAIVRRVAGRCRLEFPIGNVLYETGNSLFGLRVAPDGAHLALWEWTGSGRYLAVFDLRGQKTSLGDGSEEAITLAWSQRGDELWFAGPRGVDDAVLKVVDLRGRTRSIMALPAWVNVDDVSRDGRVLMAVTQLRSGIRCLPPGETRERDFALFSAARGLDLSPDGKTLLYWDRGPSQTAWTYLQKTDGSSGPVRLGEGMAEALSPDGRWAIARSGPGLGGQVLLPVGVGQPRTLDTQGRYCDSALWFPDGRRVLLTCQEGDRPRREYVQVLEGGESRPLTPEGTECGALSPDGLEAACVDLEGKGWIYAVEGGEPRAITGLESGEIPFQWSSDGGSVFVKSENVRLPRRIFRLELGSGRRALWKELAPADPAGILVLVPWVTPDGGAYAYAYQRALSDLYVVDGLR